MPAVPLYPGDDGEGIPGRPGGEWLKRSDIQKGPMFCAIDRWEGLEERALTPQSINLDRQTAVRNGPLDPREFAAYGLPSEYVTEGARHGVCAARGNAAVATRSAQQAASCYIEAEHAQGRAAPS